MNNVASAFYYLQTHDLPMGCAPDEGAWNFGRHLIYGVMIDALKGSDSESAADDFSSELPECRIR